MVLGERHRKWKTRVGKSKDFNGNDIDYVNDGEDNVK